MPTIRRCCIVGCLSNSRQNPQLQFFQFPRPENPFHKLWKQACQASLSRILPFKKPVVCALHFRPNCIGGRRLTSSAVPSLNLDVPHDLKAVEQQAMIEEIERSRKCAYINAVVYEWLVRANLNPQLRGSITHGMIKEKAEEARRIIGSTTFVADNRWLNRFRETHLTGFAQKLATNQLKPVGSSLWIPDIVQDLTHMFPPTSTGASLNFENVPEQYFDYMQQRYGEYEEEEEDLKPTLPPPPYQQPANPYMQPEIKPQYHHQQPAPPPPQMLGHQPPPPVPPHIYGGAYDPYAHMTPYAAAGYDDYYAYQQQQPHQMHQQPQYQQQQHAAYQHTTPPMPSPHAQTSTPNIEVPNPQLPIQPQQQQPQQQPTPTPTSQPPSRPPSQSPHHSQSSTPMPMQQDEVAAITAHTPKPDDTENPAKRARYENAADTAEEQDEDESNDGPEQQRNDNGSEVSRRSSSSDNEVASENTTSNGNDNGNADKEDEPSSPRSLGHHNGHTIRPIQLPKAPIQTKSNGNGVSPTPPPSLNGHTPSPAPQLNSSLNSNNNNNNKTNGFDQESSAIVNGKRPELQTYAQALEYLRPLEDFVLLKENFRAIGIISHLESVLRKARNRASMPENTSEELL